MANAHEIFSRIDSMDPVALAELFAENATMTLGNGEPWVGRDAIVAAVVELADITGAEAPTLRTIHAAVDLLARTSIP